MRDIAPASSSAARLPVGGLTARGIHDADSRTFAVRQCERSDQYLSWVPSQVAVTTLGADIADDVHACAMRWRINMVRSQITPPDAAKRCKRPLHSTAIFWDETAHLEAARPYAIRLDRGIAIVRKDRIARVWMVSPIELSSGRRVPHELRLGRNRSDRRDKPLKEPGRIVFRSSSPGRNFFWLWLRGRKRFGKPNHDRWNPRGRREPGCQVYQAKHQQKSHRQW